MASNTSLALLSILLLVSGLAHSTPVPTTEDATTSGTTSSQADTSSAATLLDTLKSLPAEEELESTTVTTELGTTDATTELGTTDATTELGTTDATTELGTTDAATTATEEQVEETTTTGAVTSSRSSSAAVSEQPAATEVENDCSEALTSWSPWTEKGENIKNNGCGFRRRTRKIRSPTLAQQCYGEDVELTEYIESCEQLSKNEITRSFQYYVIDRLFGWSNHEVAGNQPANAPSRQKRQAGNILLFNFGDAVNPFNTCPENPAHRPVDFLIMLDRSGSMTTSHFRLLRNSMANLISRGIPSVDKDSTRVALLTFATRATLEIDFNACRAKRCYRRMFRNSTGISTGGMTRIAHALESASEAFTTAKGSRDCSRKVILLITDGTAQSETPGEAADHLKTDKGVEIFVVGVTDLIIENQLREIVSTPVQTHLYYMNTMKTVKKVCKKLRTAMVPEEDLLEEIESPQPDPDFEF